MAYTPEICQLGAQIAQALGSAWELDPGRQESHYCHIRQVADPDCRLWLNSSRVPGMLYLMGAFPYYKGSNGLRYDERAPSMKVSATKTPERIARDIERRLLPDYLSMYQRVSQEVKDMINRDLREQARMKRLAEVLGTTPYGQEARQVFTTIQEMGVRLEPYGAETLKLTIDHVSEALAAQLLALVKEGSRG